MLTGGLLQCRRERMGLSREVLASLLVQAPAAWEARGVGTPVSVDMLRQWERGRDTMPAWVEPALDWCWAQWQRAVDELVEELAAHPGQGVAVHHSDEMMRRERLSAGDIPSAAWWRSVALEAADRTSAPLGTPRDLQRAGVGSWW